MEEQLKLDLGDDVQHVISWGKRLKQEHSNLGQLYIKEVWRQPEYYFLSLRIYIDWYFAPLLFSKEVADEVVKLSKGEIRFHL